MIISTSYLLYFAAPKPVFRTAATLIFIHIASNLILVVLPKRVFTWPLFYYSIIPADAGFIALAIFLTKAAETDFYLIFILVIILASIGRSLTYIFIGVTAMSLWYGWLVWTSHIGNNLLYNPGALLRLPFLVSVAIFIGYLSEAAQRGNRKAQRLIREKQFLTLLYERLKDSERKFRALAESTTAAIFVCKENKFIYHNPVAASLLSHGREEMLQAICNLTPECGLMVKGDDSIIRKTSPAPIASRREIRIEGENGKERWLEMTAAGIRIHGKPAVIGTAYDVTERKHAEQKLEQAAFHDFVSGLPNRAFFMDHLERIVRRAKWSGEYSYAVLYLDLDRFKWINDRFGHQTGDRLLFEVGRRLENCLKPGDIVARLGGDEFGVVLQGIRSLANAVTVAKRIPEVLGQAYIFDGVEVIANASVGLVLGNPQCPDAEHLMAAADRAMYIAKRRGGASYCVSGDDILDRPRSPLDGERDLRHAVSA
jgi:diguanylate cyclase (GGDEF)-like protein/PAS domain S-box-containing protein